MRDFYTGDLRKLHELPEVPRNNTGICDFGDRVRRQTMNLPSKALRHLNTELPQYPP